MAATDPNNLVLNSILTELQKLNAFEAQAARQAQSITQVARADAQTPVSPSLARAAGPGANLPGSLSANASTPDLLDQDALKQVTRRANNEIADQQIGGQQSGASGVGLRSDPNAEEAVAWSLLGEAGVGGPFGRLRQAQYSVSKNLGYLQGGVGAAADWLNQRSPTFGSVDSPTGYGLGDMLAPVQSGLDFLQNHELATTLGVSAISTAGNRIQDMYQQGAALGYGNGDYGVLGGFGRSALNAGATMQGADIQGLIYQLRYGGQAHGGAMGARVGQGLTAQDAQALVGQIFEQGYSMTGVGKGNMAAIAQQFAPAVNMMGQQGAQIAGSWMQSLRSANDSLTDLTSMLEQMPAAAKASQLGLEGFNQAIQAVASTVTSMGGTQSEAIRMSQQFEQAHPGLNPQDQTALLNSPFVQGAGLAQGVLPSGLSSLPGGQLNGIYMNAINMVMGGLSGLAGPQQYTTLPDGTRVPMNNPNAAVLQQASSMLGISPQDIQWMLKNPQRQQAVGREQNALGTSELGVTTGLTHLLGGDATKGGPQWQKMNAQQRQRATEYWNTQIAPSLSAAGLSQQKIRSLNSIHNIAQRAYQLNQDLYSSGGTGAGQAGNAATVQVQIGLTPQASKLVTASTPKAQVKMWQNAGGANTNSIFNSAVGQNPFFSNNGISLNGGQPGMSPNGNQTGISLGG